MLKSPCTMGQGKGVATYTTKLRNKNPEAFADERKQTTQEKKNKHERGGGG